MIIKVSTSNCTYDKPSLTNLADSNIVFTFEFQKLISVQSRNSLLSKLNTDIQQELHKFDWLICGKIQIEVSWLLNSVQRQETDKVGDLDNITKPLIDCLCGPDGICIDDSQINSIHTSWVTKRNLDDYSIVEIKIAFFNEWTVKKENLYFFECEKTIYTPINVKFGDQQGIICTKILLNGLKEQRNIVKSKIHGVDISRYLVSEYIFHRTRLHKFKNSCILTQEQFDKLFLNL